MPPILIVMTLRMKQRSHSKRKVKGHADVSKPVKGFGTGTEMCDGGIVVQTLETHCPELRALEKSHSQLANL